MRRLLLVILGVMAVAVPGHTQGRPIDAYIKDTGDYHDVASRAPGTRTTLQLDHVLPFSRSQKFAEYVAAKSSDVDLFILRQEVEKLRLNKQVGASGGSSGVTSLLSRVAAPAVLGFGVEYGSILQTNTGSTSTFRGNLLGVARMVLGAQEFPYCPEIDQSKCAPAALWLRRFSGVVSFETVSSTTTAGTASTATSTTPVGVDLFSGNFRMSSWGGRLDIASHDPADKNFVSHWETAISKMRGSQSSQDLTAAIVKLFGDDSADDKTSALYRQWRTETLTILNAATEAEFKQKLELQLNILIDRMKAASPDFVAQVATLRRASQDYFAARDELIRAIQTHQFSVEYTNTHALNQPTTSNVRVIYSTQPLKAPTLITLNGAFTWYNSLPKAPSVSRLRDVQVAGQIDRRLGEIPNLGNAVLTFGAYYQWMKEDALIEIGPGNVAPGSGIVLPGTAAQLLGTKGNIFVGQVKVTIPINNTFKMPLSVTGSNRKELINEQDIRGQIGFTVDLDSLFSK